MQLKSGIENTNPTFFCYNCDVWNNHSIHFQTIKSGKRDVYFVDTINKNMQKIIKKNCSSTNALALNSIRKKQTKVKKFSDATTRSYPP